MSARDLGNGIPMVTELRILEVIEDVDRGLLWARGRVG